MMPCHVLKVPGQGSYAINGMIPSKVLIGDGVKKVEILIPLRVVNDDIRNPVYELDTGMKIHQQLGEVITISNSSIMEAWEIFNVLYNFIIKKPYTNNMHEMFHYTGVWIKYDWSVQLMNLIFTGGLVYQNVLLANSPHHHLGYSKLPNAYRLYIHDLLISTRN